MDKSDSCFTGLVSFAGGFFLAVILVVSFPGSNVCDRCSNNGKVVPCDYTISYNGTNVSIEDAFELAGEDLTADQATSVNRLIEEYCNKSR